MARLFPSGYTRAMEQVLVFPEHEAAGLLFSAERAYSLDDSQIEWLCEASGELHLPICEYMGIVLNHNIKVRREVLAKLDPATIQLVYFYNPFELVFDELLEDLFEMERSPSGFEADDEDCELLSNLHGLRGVNLSQSKISSRGLELVSDLQSLESLSIAYTTTTDDDLASLLKLVDLRELDLSLTMISNAGIETLIHLPKLQDLSLTATCITDDALDAILKIPQLRFLDISDTAISDDSLPILQAGLASCQINF